MSTEVKNNLRQSVVAIRDTDGKVLGTGFFVGNDGSLLTCFHVVGDKDTGEAQKEYQIYFSNKKYPAECIFTSPDPRRLDVAVLRLSCGKLPDGAVLLPLGKWEAKLEVDREFRTFGFRSADTFMGLYADGVIKGKVDTAEIRAPLLQLSSEAPGQEEIRPGMSGAPVFYKATERIVGMITTRYVEKGSDSIPIETMPFAIPIDAIAKVWQPLAGRFEEQRLYDQLLHILSPAGWFTSWRLERLCKDLPAFFSVDWDVLGGDKPCALLEHLKDRRQLYTFVHWLQRKRPDIPMEELVLPTPYYNFVNREEERDKIVEGSPYIVLDAPAGYGKTALLRDVEIRYSRVGWLCIYIQVPEEPSTCVGVATSIQEVVGGVGITSLSSLSEMGRRLAAQLSEVRDQLNVSDTHEPESNDIIGIALLIDNVERMSEEEINKLVNQFVPCMQEELKYTSKFRVHFAGRYIGQKLERLAREFELMVIPLTTFKFNVIGKIIARAAAAQYHDVQLRAAHLMHTTGGHPGCMAHILRDMKFTWPPDLYFQEYREKHEEIVLSAAHLVREIVPDHLRSIFDVLSFFRRFNYRLLNQIINEKLLDWSQGDAVSLSNRLTETYLVKREHGFLHDEIVRRLLTIHMRWEEPERFIELYRKARQIYEEDLQKDIPDSNAIALEGLFTELQLGYYCYDDKNRKLEEPNQPQRKALAGQFFAPDGILNHYLEALTKKRYALDVLANLKTSLESDWEFRFTINYFLRQEQYTTEPYQRMQSQIDDFFSTRL